MRQQRWAEDDNVLSSEAASLAASHGMYAEPRSRQAQEWRIYNSVAPLCQHAAWIRTAQPAPQVLPRTDSPPRCSVRCPWKSGKLVQARIHGSEGRSRASEKTCYPYSHCLYWLTMLSMDPNGRRATLQAGFKNCRLADKKFPSRAGAALPGARDDQLQFRTSARFTNRTGFSRRGTVTMATGAVNACDVRHPIPGDTSVTMA